MTHRVKGFSIVCEAEVDIFLEFPCFFEYPADVGNLISGSFAFSISNMNIWSSQFTYSWSLAWENFQHYFSSVWDECSCAVAWAFFGIASLWDWNENWPFPVLWPLLSFPNLLAYWLEWVNLTQMTIISTTVGRNPSEEMEWPSWSTNESKMQYLDAISK